MGIVSNRLIKLLKYERSRKIVNIADLYEAQKKSEADLKTIKTPDQLGSEYHPYHAVYVSMENLVSVIAENLSLSGELEESAAAIEKSEDTYMPGYPPMSPVTTSIFTFWAFFDLRFGVDNETIGTCILDLGSILRLDEGSIELIKNLQSSRLGVYLHQGVDNNANVLLYEIFTHKLYRCHSSSKYQGKKGELWLTRLAPPPFNMSDLHVAITTPYVLLGSSQGDWETYFDQMLPRFKIEPPLLAYEELMKYGLIPDYWNEYIFQAYANHIDTAIYLHGIPNKPESLPHFEPNSSAYINLSKIRTKEETLEIRRKAAKKLKRRG